VRRAYLPTTIELPVAYVLEKQKPQEDSSSTWGLDGN